MTGLFFFKSASLLGAASTFSSALGFSLSLKNCSTPFFRSRLSFALLFFVKIISSSSSSSSSSTLVSTFLSTLTTASALTSGFTISAVSALALDNRDSLIKLKT